MAILTENLPPNLKILAEMLQLDPVDPAIEGLRLELSLLASCIQRDDWKDLAQQPASAPHVMAFYLARSFAASGAFSVSVSGSGGGALEDCPVPGCGRKRTTG